MKLQVDIPKDLNKKLKHYKIDEELPNLKEAVIHALNKFFKEDETNRNSN